MANTSKPNPIAQVAITGIVTATSEYDTFATTHHYYATGGFKKADDATERLAISTARREADLTWVLQGDSGHWWALEGGDGDGFWVDKGTNGPLDGAELLDEDDFASNSATKAPTQQSAKAYIDNGLSGKANSSHTHTESEISDLDKYTQNEVDTLLNDKADANSVVDLTSEQSVSGDKTFNGFTTAKRQINGTYDASFTLVLGSSNQRIFTVNASGTDIDITIPPNSSTAFAVGTEIEIVRYGEGEVTIVAGSGVTLRSDSSLVSIGAQYGAIMLIKYATDEWILIGNLA